MMMSSILCHTYTKMMKKKKILSRTYLNNSYCLTVHINVGWTVAQSLFMSLMYAHNLLSLKRIFKAVQNTTGRNTRTYNPVKEETLSLTFMDTTSQSFRYGRISSQ